MFLRECAFLADPPSGANLCAHEQDAWQLTLACRVGVIDSIAFASYGTPTGACGDLSQGSCHAPTSMAVVEKACLQKTSCTVQVDPATFGGDPCPNILKTLYIQVLQTLCLYRACCCDRLLTSVCCRCCCSCERWKSRQRARCPRTTPTGTLPLSIP